MPRTAPSPGLLLAALVAAGLSAGLLTGPAGVRADPLSVPAGGPVRFRDDVVLIRLSAASAEVVRRQVGEVERTGDPAAAAGRNAGEGAAAGPRSAARLARLGLPALDRAAAEFGATFEREFPDTGPAHAGNAGLSRYWIAHLGSTATAERALAAFRATAEVDLARPIAVVPVVATPDDSLWRAAYYFQQSSRRDVHAPEAWNICRGDSSVAVAILDTGVLASHPDLGGTVPGGSGRIWTNWSEAGGIAGVDDDGNGYVDDVHGWDFVDLRAADLVRPGEDWRDEDNDPNDYAGHGTGVGGLVGALTDNRIGVAGALWDVRLMPLRVGWSAEAYPPGEVDLSYAARAIVYATAAGASVVNCSFASAYQEDLDDAVTAATRAGVTVVTAAGNNGTVHYLGDRSDVISVAALDQYDVIARFSNTGDYVDVAAAGQFMATTSLHRETEADSARLRWPDYTTGASGTSFASPLVAGAAALIQSHRRRQGLAPLRPADVLLRLVDTADDISTMNPDARGYGSGRVNYERALSDPPTSFTAAVRAITVGPAAVLGTLSGVSRFAVAALDGRLLVLDGVAGELVWSVPLGAAPAGGVAAADLGDGRGLGLFVATSDGRIAGFDGNGSTLPGWPVQATGVAGLETLEPALGDLDGDGSTEVVWGGSDGGVRAWTAAGEPLAGFPRALGGPGRNALVALADLDGEPGLEIIAVNWVGTIHALRADGTSLPGWPVLAPRIAPATPPVVATLGSDPRPCVMVGGRVSVIALNPDGSLRWESVLPGDVWGSPAVGDLTYDGYDEIVVTHTPERLTVLDSVGVRLNSIEVPGLVGTSLTGPQPVIGSFRWGWPGVAVYVRSALLAWDVSGEPLPGYPRPGSAGVSPSLADLDGDGRTEIIAGSGADSVLYVYDAGVGSWNPAQPSWPTPRGNPARTGSRAGAPAIVPLDDLAPARVADLSAAVVAPGEIELHWTAPTDVGGNGRAAQYDVRFSARPIGPGDFAMATAADAAPSPAPAGTPETMRVAGLREDRTCYFALASADRAGNRSEISNLALATLPPAPPAAVTDLAVAGSTNSSLLLTWTATGDDGRRGRPATYFLRADEKPILPETFDAAPVGADVPATSDAGGRESAALAGLGQGRRYWVAVVAVDSAGHRSPVSNVAGARVGPLAARPGLAIAPARQPLRPPVELHWQLGEPAPGRIASLQIVDITGRLRASFPLGPGEEGVVLWDGRGDDGRDLRPGLYFGRISDGRRWASTRLVLLR